VNAPCVAEHLKPVNVKIAQLREALAAVSAEQIYLKARDHRHRISKSLLIKLLFYTPRPPLCHCLEGTNVLLSPVCRMFHMCPPWHIFSACSKNVILQEVT
jgi:hypothetical protein